MNRWNDHDDAFQIFDLFDFIILPFIKMKRIYNTRTLKKNQRSVQEN